MDAKEHCKLAIEYFNKTWDYIDLVDRTHQQDIEMIHTAHTSRFHWGLAEGGTDLNKARGEWQISRVYNLVGLGESALYHGKESLRLCESNNYGDFDLVFAYETIAYAYRVLGKHQKMKLYLELGYKALDQVKKQEDKDYCKSELDKIENVQ